MTRAYVNAHVYVYVCVCMCTDCMCVVHVLTKLHALPTVHVCVCVWLHVCSVHEVAMSTCKHTYNIDDEAEYEDGLMSCCCGGVHPASSAYVSKNIATQQ